MINIADNKNSKVLEICEVFDSIKFTPKAVAKADLKMLILSFGESFDLN